MKEIKAYIRRSTVSRVVERLQAEGAPGITVVEVHPVGYGFEPNYFDLEFSDPIKRYRHLEIIKLELVCSDADHERFVQAIVEECSSGLSGDGMIFLSEVAAAIRVRDGKQGAGVL